YSELTNVCGWVKDNAGMGSLDRNQHELVLVFKNGTRPHRNNVQLGQFGRNRTNVWQYPSTSHFGRRGEEGDLLAGHPTPKPVALVADALLDCSARGALVLDPFLGSGSTLIAAERVGRRCKLTKRQIIAKRLVNRAVEGDLKSVPLLLNETRLHENLPGPGAAEEVFGGPEQQPVIDSIVQRIRAAAAATSAPAPEPEVSTDEAGEDDYAGQR